MNCQQATAWIWEAPRAHDEPPEEIVAHLLGCTSCRDQRAARLAVGRDLRGLRAELEEDPPEDLDARVLASAASAVDAHQTGRYPIRADSLEGEDIPDDIADELADSIAEDFGEQFAAMTTGRLRVRRALEAQGAADLLDRTPRGRGPSSDPASASDTPAGSTWKPS